MITFLVIGIGILLLVAAGMLGFMFMNRGKAAKSPGSRHNEPTQSRAHGEGDN